MNLPRWPEAFAPIRQDFGYDEDADRDAAQGLARRLGAPPYHPERVIARGRLQCHGRRVWVLGAGPSAARDVLLVPAGDTLWTADGATLAAQAAGRVPHAIVTDLDGHPPVEALMARYGALVFVHAHGDNRETIEEHLGRFPPERVAGTCQVDPVPPVLNPGGFTDGDRAIHLALALGAAEVRPVGFDFDEPGPYSAHRDPEGKRAKLAWARRLVDALIDAGAPVRFGAADTFPSPTSGRTPGPRP